MCKISLKWLNFDLKASSSSHAAQPTDQGQEPPGEEKSMQRRTNQRHPIRIYTNQKLMLMRIYMDCVNFRCKPIQCRAGVPAPRLLVGCSSLSLVINHLSHYHSHQSTPRSSNHERLAKLRRRGDDTSHYYIIMAEVNIVNIVSHIISSFDIFQCFKSFRLVSFLSASSFSSFV